MSKQADDKATLWVGHTRWSAWRDGAECGGWGVWIVQNWNFMNEHHHCFSCPSSFFLIVGKINWKKVRSRSTLGIDLRLHAVRINKFLGSKASCTATSQHVLCLCCRGSPDLSVSLLFSGWERPQRTYPHSWDGQSSLKKSAVGHCNKIPLNTSITGKPGLGYKVIYTLHQLSFMNVWGYSSPVESKQLLWSCQHHPEAHFKQNTPKTN